MQTTTRTLIQEKEVVNSTTKRPLMGETKKAEGEQNGNALIERIRNQKYHTHKIYENNLKDSLDENKIYEVAEVEDTLDDHEGNRIDCPSDSSFRGSSLSEEERKPGIVREERKLKHRYADTGKDVFKSEGGEFKAYRYIDLRFMTIEESQNLLTELCSCSANPPAVLSPKIDLEHSTDLKLKDEAAGCTHVDETFQENPLKIENSFSEQITVTANDPNQSSSTAEFVNLLLAAVKELLSNNTLTMEDLIEQSRSRGLLSQCNTVEEVKEALKYIIAILNLKEELIGGKIYYSLKK
ncbi:unnamed protein product [Hymenolepis diminuta]|uniref:Mediator of RNA polymerase II transcription subunit 17 n=1 Tax=Hymenolepis diminuta TaxID=6216 RepID=A0A158QGE0_HYMDI|nr:unnamed protein product [Hymenolepis diminuta]